MTYLQDILESITAKIKEDLGLPDLFFFHETPFEVINEIANAYNNAKFPMIALFRPFEQSTGLGFIECPNVSILIADLTELNMTIKDRYDEAYTTILHPIMGALKNYCERDFRLIRENNRIDFKFVDKHCWALTPDSNDVINAIELNITFKIKNNNC